MFCAPSSVAHFLSRFLRQPMIRVIVIALNLLVAGCMADHGSHWSYTNSDTNPSHWARLNSRMCSGWAQSPIALESDAATYLGAESEAAVNISVHSSENSATFSATNNGHSLAITIPEGKWQITLNNKARNYYKVSQFHFHWGGEDVRGSEHTLDSRTFPLEMHIVAYSSMYASLTDAQAYPGGLAVIGVFFQLTADQAKSSLSQMGNLLSKIGELTIAGSKTDVNSFEPSVLLPENRDEFFRYSGSLTTPPCTENVQWTVMKNPLSVTSADLELLRSLRFGGSDDEKPMQDNFRPVQPLNPVQAAQPRVLYKSWSAASRPIATVLFLVSLDVTYIMLSG
ncbi:carbonate dehydratase activity [Sparganum proliferum]